MAVAIFKVHWPNGLMAQDHGFEYPMTLFFVSLYFMIRGAGPFSIDGLIGRPKAAGSNSSEM
jgi:putative oxidoreductase